MPLPLDLPSLFTGFPDRTWLSFATVDDESPVTFDPELGPLVSVTTHPEGRPLVCRVGMRLAGRGEGEYEPFVAGDELLVAIVEGHPRAGGVVLCRLCNAIDRFPTDVMGQDPTTNAFGFSRRIAPHVQESAGPLFARQAGSGAFIGIAADGTITLRDGSAGALQLSADVLGMQSGDARYLVQLDVTGGRFSVQAGDALLTLSSSDASPEKSAIAVPGTLALSTAANPAAEHVLTVEAFMNLFVNLFPAIIAGLLSPPPADPANTFFAAVVTGINAASVPLTGTLDPRIAGALFTAFTAATQKPPAVPGLGQVLPGIGCAGLLSG
jgi:hypothetical protein